MVLFERIDLLLHYYGEKMMKKYESFFYARQCLVLTERCRFFNLF